ncbi:hypothetical protein C8R44DRAFT_897676 [Mycena epipterygia]|nr:hypothetical protein C8R44DRAFT_897676 [Mycena epipterygia]
MPTSNQPNWLSLPVEIWLHILGLRIPLRDLGELCLACSQLLSITRPILYRNLTLTAEKHLRPNFAVIDTFALLARDADLARSVRELTLDSQSDLEAYYRNPGLVDIGSLQNLTQLKRLTIIGDIARHAGMGTISKMIQILHDLQLDELRFPAPGARAFMLAPKPAQLGQLANPQNIEWHVGLLAPRVIIFLTAATPSLTSLSLTIGRLSDFPTQELFSLRFPLLRSLALIGTPDNNFSSPPGLNAFLSAHHQTLEALHLGCNHILTDRTLDPLAIMFDATTELHPDFLPNLQVFRGHYQNVEMMARARMRCLTTLRELTINSSSLNPYTIVVGIGRMLDAVEAAGDLKSLKDLDFNLFQWHAAERDFVPAFVRRLGVLCGPTLERWHGLLPFLGSWPLDVFSPFVCMRAIRFPKDSTLLNGFLHDFCASGDIADCVRSLAETCSALEDVMIVGAEDWKIDRHSVSGISLRCVD